jgi:hypothetical protein
MDIQPIAFFFCSNNNIFKAQQETCLLSSQFAGDHGFYLYKTPSTSIRRSITLFSDRSLPKHTWINDNNRFLGLGK